MSYFLARLVERARGTAPRVEPVVAPRFAPSPIVEIASEVETPPLERRHHQPKVEEKSSPRAVVQQETPGEKDEANIVRESEKSSLPQQPGKLLVPMEMGSVDSTVFVRASQPADRPVPGARNGAVKRNSVTASPAKRPRSATPVTKTLRHFERSAVTPNESPEEPPIVRITIGRIDVRAAPPAAPSRKSPTRSEPKLTLDAYLKARKEGTR
jgi:hypothetical protein